MSDTRSAIPHRALIVSADVGEGHNSAGRALEEAMARTWPGCEVRWLDTLALLGPGFARFARRCYASQVERLPWMYDFLFSAMWRHRWYLDSTRRAAGSLFGRRLAPRIGAFRPDVIVSTYPLGSAGLSWLRRRGRLGMPVGAWVSAFCPHPSWLYRDLDLTFVMHPAAAAMAARAEPGLPLAVGALPVRSSFVPADREAARARLGLEPGRFTALVCTGSLAFGRVGRAVTALLGDVPGIQVTVACGKNERLRRELAGRGLPPDRLRVLGWTDDMPGWMAASDVVIGNAGGATGLEAVASGRPIILFEPIAGHGRANAKLMAEAGLALLAWSPAELTATVRRLAGDPTAVAKLADVSLATATARHREDDLAALAAVAAG